MRVFICWLINVSDWLGELSFGFLIAAIPKWGAGVILFGAIAAIIPSIITTVYATMNYDLVLSWAIIRWMSPLNIVTNQLFYFIKTLILSGAAWAFVFTYVAHKLFPNNSFEWAISLVRNVVDSIYNILS